MRNASTLTCPQRNSMGMTNQQTGSKDNNTDSPTLIPYLDTGNPIE